MREAAQLRGKSHGLSWWTVLYGKRTSQQNVFCPDRWTRQDCSVLPSRTGRGIVDIPSTQAMPSRRSGEAARLTVSSPALPQAESSKTKLHPIPQRPVKPVAASLKPRYLRRVSCTSPTSRVSSSEEETNLCFSFKVTLCTSPFLLFKANKVKFLCNLYDRGFNAFSCSYVSPHHLNRKPRTLKY